MTNEARNKSAEDMAEILTGRDDTEKAWMEDGMVERMPERMPERMAEREGLIPEEPGVWQEDCNDEFSGVDLYYVDCEREEREKREHEMAERRKFVEGMMKYPEMGIAVYIDDKIPEEQRDWDKLTVIREDHRFYMADFIEDQEHGGLKEVRWNKVYHGELESETAKRKRGRRRKQ